MAYNFSSTEPISQNLLSIFFLLKKDCSKNVFTVKKYLIKDWNWWKPGKNELYYVGKDFLKPKVDWFQFWIDVLLITSSGTIPRIKHTKYCLYKQSLPLHERISIWIFPSACLICFSPQLLILIEGNSTPSLGPEYDNS